MNIDHYIRIEILIGPVDPPYLLHQPQVTMANTVHGDLVDRIAAAVHQVDDRADCSAQMVTGAQLGFAPPAPPDASPLDGEEQVSHLIQNAARCDECGDVIESTSVHDFRWCSCGALAVDGGLHYPKRVFTPEKKWTDLCEYADE